MDRTPTRGHGGAAVARVAAVAVVARVGAGALAGVDHHAARPRPAEGPAQPATDTVEVLEERQQGSAAVNTPTWALACNCYV